MFSGIIQGTGVVENKEFNIFHIKTSLKLDDCKPGSSISCNGVCLTATSITKLSDNCYIFTVDISEETINRSNFRNNYSNSLINIEKSLKMGDEISGHFVYGHVDCVAQIINISKLDSSWNFEFKKNNEMNKFIVEKGSISINGISLTIANATSDKFSISIIPHTFNYTNLNKAKINDFVNVEYDQIARYLLQNDQK